MSKKKYFLVRKSYVIVEYNSKHKKNLMHERS